MDTKHTPTEGQEPKHELSDVTPAPAIVFGIAVAILIAGSIFAVISLLNVFETRSVEGQKTGPALIDTEQLPLTGPRLQADPERDLRELQAADQAVLTSYGWVDRDAGRVRVPIERAMDLILERGLPVRDDVPERSD